MLIRVIRSFCLRPGVDVIPGDVIEATRHEALSALHLGRAVEAEPEEGDEPSAVASKPKAPSKWGRK